MNLNNMNINLGEYQALGEERRRSSALSSIGSRQLSTQTDVTCLDDLEEYGFEEADVTVGQIGYIESQVINKGHEYIPGAEIAVTAADISQLCAVQEEEDDVSQISGEIFDFLRRDQHNTESGGVVSPLPGTSATLAQADSYSNDLDSIHSSEVELRSCGIMRNIFLTPAHSGSLDDLVFNQTHSIDYADESCDDDVTGNAYIIEHVFPVLRYGADGISPSVASLASSVANVATAQHKQVFYRK